MTGAGQSSEAQDEAPRAWQRMLSGRRLDLLDPSAVDVEIADIAHGLARVARWNGQTHGVHALSVAQHAVIVHDIACAMNPDLLREWRLAALLHDAPEYVVGDLISPFKAAIGLDYKAFELKLLAAVHARFGLPAQLPKPIQDLIKSADRLAAYYEATRLAGFSEDEAQRYFGVPVALAVPVAQDLDRLEALATTQAQAMFLATFERLSS